MAPRRAFGSFPTGSSILKHVVAVGCMPSFTAERAGFELTMTLLELTCWRRVITFELIRFHHGRIRVRSGKGFYHANCQAVIDGSRVRRRVRCSHGSGSSHRRHKRHWLPDDGLSRWPTRRASAFDGSAQCREASAACCTVWPKLLSLLPLSPSQIEVFGFCMNA
jgi:hypothetical protein